jgi:hypothetical protein
MRHRLGFTVGGASSPSRKRYAGRFHTGVPFAVRITPSTCVPMKPRRASSKSVLSSNGSRAASAAFACRVAGSASFCVMSTARQCVLGSVMRSLSW